MNGWTNRQHDDVVKLLVLVAEVSGSSVSEAAAALIVRKLESYPHAAVMAALNRCAVECKHRLTLADIVERIDDCRPSVEEAWARFPKSEEEAGVVTDEMLTAWDACYRLYADGDKVGARMAFKESYERSVREARSEGRPARWQITAGLDRSATEGAVVEAMRRGLIAPDHALKLIPPDRHERALKAAGVKSHPLLEAPRAGAQGRKELAGLIEQLGAKMQQKDAKP